MQILTIEGSLQGERALQANGANAHQQAVIELRGIHKSYGALEVIQGVGQLAHKGVVTALIGSSRSGKST